ncbi:MAG: hypothetical protein AB8G23_09590 [Myxococcota bacterium]
MNPIFRALSGSPVAALSALLLLLAATHVQAQGAEAADTDTNPDAKSETERIEELEEQVGVLAEELGRLESVFAVPEELALVSVNGLGPAASKVYKKDKGLSIGGYGEVRLRRFEDKEDDNQNDIFDALRAVLYVGYKYNDKWVINSELEFEHGGTSGGGSVSTEFLTLDYLWRDEVNLRAGLVLVPMGFVNEIHEPNFFFGAERPEIERQILPSTWRENGVGVFGQLGDRVSYRAYVINGLDASGFSASGLRGGRQKGSRALSNDFAFVGRADVDVAPGLQIGGSVYTGQTGQEQDSDATGAVLDLPDSQTTIYELHTQYKGYGVSFRALWTEAFIDEAGKLSRVRNLTGDDSVAQHMRGWYAEIAYDIMPIFRPESRMSFEPFFRFEQYDTQRDVATAFQQDDSRDIDLYEVGIQFKPIPEVVFKLDYRHFDPRDGHRANEVQAALGYVF